MVAVQEDEEAVNGSTSEDYEGCIQSLDHLEEDYIVEVNNFILLVT